MSRLLCEAISLFNTYNNFFFRSNGYSKVLFVFITGVFSACKVPVALLVSWLCLHPVTGYADDTALHDLDIPSQTLVNSLNDLSTQTGTLVLFPYDLVKDMQGQAVRGRFTVPQAVAKMLEHTRLVGVLSSKGVLTVSLKSPISGAEEPNQTQSKRGLWRQLLSLFAGNPAAQFDKQSNESIEEVVVTGVRHGLETAVAQKRTANFVVDGVAAEDIGKFPDANVAESLQRIAGVAIARDRGIGQRVSVRGLGPEFNAVTLNGRILATDNEGREFNFDVLPSELISGAQVIKTAPAEYVEGSIGGLINISTPRPFDFDGLTASVGVDVKYDRFADDTSPNLYGLFSNTLSDNSLGVLLSFSYREEDYRTDIFNPAAYETFDNDGDGRDDTFRPDSIRFSQITGDRERLGLNSVLQFAPSDHLRVTADALFFRFQERETTRGLFLPFQDGYMGETLGVINQVIGNNNTVSQVTSLGNITFGPSDGGVTGQRVDVIQEVDPRLSDTVQFGIDVEYDVTNTVTFDADISYSEADDDDFGTDSHFTVTGFNGGTATYVFRPDGVPDVVFGRGNSLVPSQFRAHFARFQNKSISDQVLDAKFGMDWALEVGAVERIKVGVGYTGRSKEEVEARSPQGNLFNGYQLDLPDEFFGVPITGLLSDEPGNFPRNIPTFDGVGVINFLEDLVPGSQYGPIVMPSRGFLVEEDTLAIHIQADLGGTVQGLPWRANVGLRRVQTDVLSSGESTVLLDIIPPSATDPDPVLVIETVATSVPNDYVETLWSANFTLDLADDLIFRLAAGKALTRPTLTQLSTRVSFSRTGFVSAGNPNLMPFLANQLDVALEYYPERSTALSATYFRKSLSSFVADITQTETFAGFEFESTRPRNGESASIDGLELSILHSFASGAGFQVTGTLIDTEAQFDESLGNAAFAIEGLSDTAYSLTAFYDKGRLQGRLSYTWRSSYLDVAFGGFGQPEIIRSRGQLDASIGYRITDKVTLTLEGVNLTDEVSNEFQSFRNRVRDIEYFGTRFEAGIRIDF